MYKLTRIQKFNLAAVAMLCILAAAFPEHVTAENMQYAPAIFAGSVLDVFKQDAFGVLSLTDAINKQPFVPGRAGQLIDWNPRGVTTTTILVEEKNGVLTILNPSPRGGVGDAIDKQKRTMRPLVIPHYQRNDAIYADEVQGVREFGTEASTMTVQGLLDNRLADHTRDMDLTLEYQRVGALKGIVLNGDGSTLVNLFTAFEVSQETEVDFDLDNASPAAGALRKKCMDVTRLTANNMGGDAFFGVHALCGDTFFDQLLAHVEVRNSYLNTDMARVLRDGYIYPNNQQKVYGAFEFGGIVFENYRGTVNGSAIIEATKAHFFPMGAPGLFKTVFAPADYVETVNTVGLPRYAKQFPFQNDKGIAMEMQMNALSYCTRPKVLIKAKNT